MEDIAVYTISRTSDTSVAIGSEALVAARNEGSILCAHCSCMAGLGEVCSHMGALLFILDMYRNTQYQKTTTCASLLCSWLNVPYSELAEISFAAHKWCTHCRSE